MNEENNMVENQVETPTTQEEVQPETQPTESKETQQEVEKMYTKAQIIELMKRRVERSHQSFFKRYGVQDLKGLDDLFNKQRSYDEMEKGYGALQVQNKELEQKISFLENNIEPNRYADIKAYFKGNDLEFSNEALIEALKTHPEWLKTSNNNTTTVKSLGVNQNEVSSSNEKEIASKIFGTKL